MNILTSWRESLRVFEPRQCIILMRSCRSALSTGIRPTWFFFGLQYQLLLNPQLTAYFSIFCDAHIWGATNVMVTMAAIEQRVHLLTPQSRLSLSFMFLVVIFVIVSAFLQMMSYSNERQQQKVPQDNRFCDVPLVKTANDDALAPIKMYGALVALLCAWVGIFGLAVHLARIFHVSYRYVSYIAYFMLMPHAPLKEISLGSYVGSITSVWPYILALGAMGACWPVCVIFIFFMRRAGNTAYAALRNSICLIIQRYPAFLVIRLAIHALLMIAAMGGNLVLSLGSGFLYLAYWCVMCYFIAYVSWEFLWQFMFVLCQMWSPHLQQSSQSPQDHHDDHVALNSGSN